MTFFKNNLYIVDNQTTYSPILKSPSLSVVRLSCSKVETPLNVPYYFTSNFP